MIAGLSLALLFNSLWVLPAQRRADVPAITAWPAAEVARITESLIADVTLGPPDFAVSSGGQIVLDAAERGHMRDVYLVIRAFAALVAVAAMTLAILAVRYRREAWWWRRLGQAAIGAAIVAIVAGVVFALFFDQAWLAFHLVFFPEGNFTFDARVERLTQLFPVAFWTESVMAVFGLGLLLAGLVWTVARLIARRLATA